MNNIVELFKVPIYKTILSLNTNSIINYCKKIQKNDLGKKSSNIGGWHSNNLVGQHLDLNDLFINIEKHVNIFSKQCNFLNSIELKDIWININSTNNFNLIHTHPNCKFSGVYYVKTPKNSGDLVFYNPSCDMMIYDWNDDFKNFNSYNSHRFVFPIQENQLYLFPSWLKHSVNPNLSNKERVSLSFNFK